VRGIFAIVPDREDQKAAIRDRTPQFQDCPAAVTGNERCQQHWAEDAAIRSPHSTIWEAASQ